METLLLWYVGAQWVRSGYAYASERAVMHESTPMPLEPFPLLMPLGPTMC